MLLQDLPCSLFCLSNSTAQLVQTNDSTCWKDSYGSAPAFSSPGSHETADAEITKDSNHQYPAEKLAVVGRACVPCCASAPQGIESVERENGEEDANYLQKQHSREADEWPDC